MNTTALALDDRRWSADRANGWYNSVPWMVGCNFTPSTAINQLEMWQAESFDPVTIDRELAWASELGFNTVRVFLHDLLWKHDRDAFVKRIEAFLGSANRHGIGAMLVLLDACWDPHPKLGQQRAPQPGLHNSGWVQSPGAEILRDPARHDELREYITGVVTHFRDDPRVQMWDLFNEPDNRNVTSYVGNEPRNKHDLSVQLLKKAFSWARAANPTQPLTSGVWVGNWGCSKSLADIERVQLEESDVISFHNYAGLEEFKRCVKHLRRYGRPIVCTEYMARPADSTFEQHLTFMKDEQIGAYNWGFVHGKTQTAYPWDSWSKSYSSEPLLWFHDILRSDGTPYDRREVEFIKTVTGRFQQSAHGIIRTQFQWEQVDARRA